MENMLLELFAWLVSHRWWIGLGFLCLHSIYFDLIFRKAIAIQQRSNCVEEHLLRTSCALVQMVTRRSLHHSKRSCTTEFFAAKFFGRFVVIQIRMLQSSFNSNFSILCYEGWKFEKIKYFEISLLLDVDFETFGSLSVWTNRSNIRYAW